MSFILLFSEEKKQNGNNFINVFFTMGKVAVLIRPSFLQVLSKYKSTIGAGWGGGGHRT